MKVICTCKNLKQHKVCKVELIRALTSTPEETTFNNLVYNFPDCFPGAHVSMCIYTFFLIALCYEYILQLASVTS